VIVRSLCLFCEEEDVLIALTDFIYIYILCNRVTFRRVSFSYTSLAVYTLPFISLLNFCQHLKFLKFSYKFIVDSILSSLLSYSSLLLLHKHGNV
jgi:hypothetical protein